MPACLTLRNDQIFEDENYHLISGLTYVLTIVTNIVGHMCIYCAVGDLLTERVNMLTINRARLHSCRRIVTYRYYRAR